MAYQVTLEELKGMVENARETIWEQAKSQGRNPKEYLHWSAGRYDSVFDDYHINITGAGKIFVTTNDLSEIKSHTWRRNTGSIGISLCCAYNATSNDLGEYAPTDIQIETIAKVIDIVATGLWLTINKEHVLTHGEAADNEDGIWCHEPYGPKNGCERWDLEFLETAESPKYDPWDEEHRGGSILRGKAIWYHNQRSAKTATLLP